jgi:hypothetical protein
LFAETCVVNQPNFGCRVDLNQIKNPLSSEESYSYGLVTKSRKIDLVYNRCSDDFPVKQLWILIHDQMWGTPSDHRVLTILLKNKKYSLFVEISVVNLLVVAWI